MLGANERQCVSIVAWTRFVGGGSTGDKCWDGGSIGASDGSYFGVTTTTIAAIAVVVVVGFVTMALTVAFSGAGALHLTRFFQGRCTRSGFKHFVCAPDALPYLWYRVELYAVGPYEVPTSKRQGGKLMGNLRLLAFESRGSSYTW